MKRFSSLFYWLGSLITLVLFGIAAWLSVHILAIFGIFLTVAYSVAWLLFPQKVLCFFCQTKKMGEVCPVCRNRVTKSESVWPKTLTSMVANTILILGVTLTSVGTVAFEAKILSLVLPSAKTASFTIPSKGQFKLGEIFPMKLEITGLKTPINAIQTDISFVPDQLEVLNISLEGSIATTFLQKEINNQVGFLRLTGGLPNPGFDQDHGMFATVFFRSKKPGLTQVEFLPSSLILANDGQGSNVIKDLAKISYLILPEPVSASEQQAQVEALGPKVLGSSKVLGISTDKPIMTFFTESNILGESDEASVSAADPVNINKAPPVVRSSWLHTILAMIARLDELIINAWSGVFE